MAPTYNDDTESYTYNTEPDVEVESGRVELTPAVNVPDDTTADVEPAVEPVEEPAPKRKSRRSKPSRAQVRKVRGGKVTKNGEEFAVNGKVYEVEPDVAAWLLNLTNGYGQPYFESA